MVISGGDNVSVTGSGAKTDPFVIGVDVVTPDVVTDAAIDAHLGGDATSLVPTVEGLQATIDELQQQVAILSAAIPLPTDPGDPASITQLSYSYSLNESTISDIFDSVDSNWAINNAQVVKVGKMVNVYISATRAANAIPTYTSGDIANSDIGVLGAHLRPPNYVTFGTGIVGFLNGGFVNPDGTMSLSAIAPGRGVEVGRVLSFGLSYITSTYASDDGF